LLNVNKNLLNVNKILFFEFCYKWATILVIFNSEIKSQIHFRFQKRKKFAPKTKLDWEFESESEFLNSLEAITVICKL